jgi:hypothetical protein
LAIGRDQNAAINLENYGINKLRVASPEVTSVDKKALAYLSSIEVSETVLGEAEILMCSLLST